MFFAWAFALQEGFSHGLKADVILHISFVHFIGSVLLHVFKIVI